MVRRGLPQRLPQRLSSQGVLHLPLCLILLAIMFAGFGTWSVLRSWRFMMETQLRLNRCVGVAAQEFRDRFNSLIRLNQEIYLLRGSILAASLQPELIPPLKVALGGVVAQQEAVLAQWKLQQVKWLIPNHCGDWKDGRDPLPDLEFVRDPPDTLGPQSLRWSGAMSEAFSFQAKNKTRVAAAHVEGGSYGGISEYKKWKAFWAVPRSGWVASRLSWKRFP